MTAIAPDADQLRELDEGKRAAWAAYRRNLQELSGEEYEHAESRCWTELQDELSRLERQRQKLTARRG